MPYKVHVSVRGASLPPVIADEYRIEGDVLRLFRRLKQKSSIEVVCYGLEEIGGYDFDSYAIEFVPEEE